MAERIEQRGKLRAEGPLPGATIIVRGGPDNLGKLRESAQRTARAWSLDGEPLLGISVFAVTGTTLSDILAGRFGSYRMIHLSTVSQLSEFELLATGRGSHYTVRLQRADDPELDKLLAALGAASVNPQYTRGGRG